MQKRTVISISLNEKEMKMFNELKESIYEMYYGGTSPFNNINHFTNSQLLKHLITHEHYIAVKIEKDFRN